MFRLLRATQSNWPRVRIKNIVDDINMQANCNQADVVSSIAGATHQLTTGLLALDLPLSAKKTAFMASSCEAAKQTIKALRPLRIPRRTTVRNLGTDAGGGARRSSATQITRLAEALRRSLRVKSSEQQGPTSEDSKPATPLHKLFGAQRR